MIYQQNKNNIILKLHFTNVIILFYISNQTFILLTSCIYRYKYTFQHCIIETINSRKIGTFKGVYLPILKLHSILAAANKFATAKIQYSFELYRQINTYGGTINFFVDYTYPS